MELKEKEILKRAYIQAIEKDILREIEQVGQNSIIEKILKKDKWDGRDLGILDMSDLINSRRYYNNLGIIENTYTDETRKKYNDTFNSLSPEDKETFYGYRNIKIWLLNSYYLSMAHIQTRTGKYNYLMGRIRDLYFTETAYNYFMHNVKETDKATNDLIAEYQRFYNENFKPFSVFKYTEKEKKEKRLEYMDDIDDALKETFNSYIFLKGYNKAIDIVAKFYEIPDLILFKYKGIFYIPEEYNKYNMLVEKVKDAVEKQYITKLEKILKITTINQVFKPLKTFYEIPEEKIKQAKETLSHKDFTPFYSSKDILNILCK